MDKQTNIGITDTSNTSTNAVNNTISTDISNANTITTTINPDNYTRPWIDPIFVKGPHIPEEVIQQMKDMLKQFN